MTPQLISAFIFAIGQLESGNNPNVPDRGDCVGQYQIKRVFVDEINRLWLIRGVNPMYTYADRKKQKICRAMISDWLNLSYANATQADCYEIALSYKCGRTGRLKATDKDKDYARRVVEIVKERAR